MYVHTFVLHRYIFKRAVLPHLPLHVITLIDKHVCWTELFIYVKEFFSVE